MALVTIEDAEKAMREEASERGALARYDALPREKRLMLAVERLIQDRRQES